MKAKAQAEKRGRKLSQRPIAKNGLYVDQWERILTDAATQGTNGAILLRQIVGKYYDDLEKQEAKYSSKAEFEKLPTHKL